MRVRWEYIGRGKMEDYEIKALERKHQELNPFLEWMTLKSDNKAYRHRVNYKDYKNYMKIIVKIESTKLGVFIV